MPTSVEEVKGLSEQLAVRLTSKQRQHLQDLRGSGTEAEALRALIERDMDRAYRRRVRGDRK